MRTKSILRVILLTLSIAQPAFAAEAESKPQKEVGRLSLEIASGHPETQARAVERMRELIQSNPELGVRAMKARWRRGLMDQGLYEQTAELAQLAILARPRATGTVSALQHARVLCLLKVHGKEQDALAAAKSFYNVATLDQTAEAVELLGQALAAARPQDTDVAARFKLAQARAEAPRTKAASAPAAESIFKTIEVDPAPYEQAAAEIKADPVNPAYELVAKGNLLLLADRGKEAREAFERAFKTGNRSYSSAAIADIARALRAEDGNVARANAWILSQQSRPKSNTLAPNGKKNLAAPTTARAQPKK